MGRVDLTIPHLCPYCEYDWNFYTNIECEIYAHWMIDVRTDPQGGDRFISFHPCCFEMAQSVQEEGYKVATGRTQKEVVQEIIHTEVLKVTEEGDSAIVCRLDVEDPTVITARGKGKSPRGWQTEIFTDVDKHHRHHPAPQGWKFGIAVYNGNVKVGVLTAGRPVSRVLDDGTRLEVTRVCTWGHPELRKNAVSKLYAAAAKVAKKMGYERLITYTLYGVESGHSLKASGWTPTVLSEGGGWKCAARPKASTKSPTGRKVRWERGLTKRSSQLVQQGIINLDEIPPPKPKRKRRKPMKRKRKTTRKKRNPSKRMDGQQLLKKFDSLKYGDKVWVSVEGWAGTLRGEIPKYREFKVGRKSTSKKYKYEKIPLLSPSGKKSKYFLWKRIGPRGFYNEPVYASLGDLGVELFAIRKTKPT